LDDIDRLFELATLPMDLYHLQCTDLDRRSNLFGFKQHSNISYIRIHALINDLSQRLTLDDDKALIDVVRNRVSLAQTLDKGVDGTLHFTFC
jgi:hypothetical protein